MRGIAESTIVLAQYAYELLAELHPMTLRQLHYAIFSTRVIPYETTQADYKRLSRATTIARRVHRQWELGAVDSVASPTYGTPSQARFPSIN